jgi:hypothetical protein
VTDAGQRFEGFEIFGTAPPCSATIRSANAFRFFAFDGARPQERMSERISGSESRASVCAVFARLKSAGGDEVDARVGTTAPTAPPRRAA